MRFLALLLACCLSACASYDANDGAAVETGVGYVVLSPHFRFGNSLSERVDLNLVRVTPDKRTENIYLPKTLNGTRTVVKLAPGYYFLTKVHDGGHNWVSNYTPATTLFEVKRGVLNYPGDWLLTIHILDSDVSGTVGRGALTIQYRTSEKVVDSAETRKQVAARYPNLSRQLPLEFVRVVLPSQDKP